MGPGDRTRVNWLDWFLLMLFIPFIFLCRAATIILNTLKIMKISHVMRTIESVDRLKDNLSDQLESWFWLILWRALSSNLVIAAHATITKVATLLIYAIFGVPIVFYAFFKSVYDFGPANVPKRSLLEIIRNPVPPESG